MNYPGIDLGDERNRIAVQVTAESDREKLEKTIETFEKEGCQTRYDRLIQAAVTGSLQGEEGIYFNRCLDHKIYGVRPGDADARQVCAFPESMFLIDMAAIE